jgi:hypothetical protein
MWWWQFLRELQAQKQNLYFLSSKNETFVQHFAMRTVYYEIGYLTDLNLESVLWQKMLVDKIKRIKWHSMILMKNFFICSQN